MKNYLKVLFASMLLIAMCHTNVDAQGVKGVFNKTKDAINKATKKEVSKTTGGKSAASESPSAGPAKPLAPEVKNSVSEIRAMTGLTKEAFLAKMKSQGFVESQEEFGMNGTVYKSKSKGYLLGVEFGTRGNAEFVRSVTKGIPSKAPNFGTIKTTFLDLGKQCTSLKATYSGGFLKAINSKNNVKNVRNAEERTAKFLPAFNTMISAKEEGGAVDQYAEKDYDYMINYTYAKVMGSIITIQVTDLTIESMFG